MTYNSQKFRDLLKAQGRSVDWLGEMTEYDPSTVSRFLNDKQVISSKFAERAARALGVPVEWLVEEQEPSHAA